jgi:dihydrofolate reductase
LRTTLPVFPDARWNKQLPFPAGSALRFNVRRRSTTYSFAAFWPYQDRTEQPYTDYLNNTPKYVVSRTLEEPLEWQNSTLIKGNVAEELSRLKEQPGKDIGIVGSGALVRWLLHEELLDELMLMVHPIVLGRGRRLFEEGAIRRR